MALRRFEERDVEIETYVQICIQEHMASAGEAPVDARFVSYRCGSGEFLASDTYPVWFTDPKREQARRFSDPDARPLTYQDLLNDPGLAWLLSEKIDTPLAKAGSPRPHVIVEHCVGCGRYVVKDGCKRLLRIAVGRTNADLSVTQVEGRDWSNARYDMARICACQRGVREDRRP